MKVSNRSIHREVHTTISRNYTVKQAVRTCATLWCHNETVTALSHAPSTAHRHSLSNLARSCFSKCFPEICYIVIRFLLWLLLVFWSASPIIFSALSHFNATLLVIVWLLLSCCFMFPVLPIVWLMSYTWTYYISYYYGCLSGLQTCLLTRDDIHCLESELRKKDKLLDGFVSVAAAHAKPF